MIRLQRSPWIFWLLMLCIGAQGIGAAAHRIGHGSHNADRATRASLSADAASRPAVAASSLAVVASQRADAAVELSKLSAQTDDGNTQKTELCLVCANLAAAKHLSVAPFWLAYTAFKAPLAVADLHPIGVGKASLFALARAPPSDLS
jgi:hypothetical protein